MLLASVQLRGCALEWNVATYGRVIARPLGRIRVGARTTIAPGLLPTALVAERGAVIDIGAECVLNGGATIRAHQQVSIGRGCLIAGGVVIDDRHGDTVAPIVIGDNVWLAHGAYVGPGVTIGRNSVVSAGSRVTSDIPEDSLAIGDPARAVPMHCAAPARLSA